MRYRSFVVTALAASLLVGACQKEPPPPPAPTGPTEEELAQRRADSIAAARAAEERARREAEEARRRAEEARRRALEEAREALTMMIHFDFDESEIRPDAERILREKVEVLRSSPRVQMQIEGHCDERGSNEYNLALGNRRAQAVVDFFTNYGLDADRFTIVSFGEEQPLVNRSNEEAWAQNRRAEFNITAGENDINVEG